ncbi:MAG: hypothetical protein JW936_04935 [Sedimentisphaerales bacterium]|nr:hypothetical protein [Sedimentisphaerales bacterium]
MTEPEQNNQPMPQQSPEEPKRPSASKHPHERIMLVKYGKMGMLGLFLHEERHIPVTTKYVVVHTERGMEIGELLMPFFHRKGNCEFSADRIENYCKSSGQNYPLSRNGRFVRFATDQDLNEQRHLEQQAIGEQKYCAELIAKHQLPMQLVTIEHLFGGDRIIYYFMAEGRVDFRQLVKELAHEYQTRIEMRQVGARDEARIIADFETCGRECCCKNFLKILQPVNMRMAKLQKATLDPTKISGRCGRLKCCLRYEDEVYTELRKKLPRNNSTVLTEKGPGTVIGGQIITQLVKVRLDNNAVIAVGVDEILQRDYKRPETPPNGNAQPSVKPDTPKQNAQPARQPQEKENGAQPQPQTQQQTPDASPGSDNNDPEQNTTRKKKRRRRRRKKSSQSSEPDASNNNGSNNYQSS